MATIPKLPWDMTQIVAYKDGGSTIVVGSNKKNVCVARWNGSDGMFEEVRTYVLIT